MMFHYCSGLLDNYWFLSYKQTTVKPLQQIEDYLLAVCFLSDIGTGVKLAQKFREK